MGTEFRRAFGWPFAVAMLAMTAVFMSSSFEELLCTADNPGLSYYYLFAMAEMLSPHVYVAPFLCALPYAASFADELNHHYLPLMLQRQGTRRYLNRRMLTAFASGFGVYFGGLLLAGVIHIIFGNPIPPGELRELWFESWVPRDDLWEYIFAGDHGAVSYTHLVHRRGADKEVAVHRRADQDALAHLGGGLEDHGADQAGAVAVQQHVLALAGLDRERLGPGQGADLVGEQARRVDDVARLHLTGRARHGPQTVPLR